MLTESLAFDVFLTVSLAALASKRKSSHELNFFLFNSKFPGKNNKY